MRCSNDPRARNYPQFSSRGLADFCSHAGDGCCHAALGGDRGWVVNMHSPIRLGDQDDDFRRSHVGGSEVSALFDCNHWLTHFELWHRKAGTIDTPDFSAVAAENERIQAGIYMEPSIIRWACDKWGYRDAAPRGRFDNGKGLGGHPDALADCPERDCGVLEVKTVDWLAWKQWGDEPPLHYQLQCQAYMGLAGLKWGDLIILVGGNQLERVQYQFRPKLYAEIERRVEAFWRSIKAGDAPKADYSRDGQTIDELFANPNDTLADLRGDNLATMAAAEFMRASADEKEAAKRKETARAELIEKMAENNGALLDGYRVNAPAIAATPDKEITAEMVGTIINGRKGCRRFAVKEIA